MKNKALFSAFLILFSALIFSTCNKYGDIPIQVQNETPNFKSALKCEKPSNGMVGWWAAEGNANDKFGNNHGIEMNGATYADGIVGTAFSFDGIDDFIKVPKSNSLDVGSQVTIEFWIKSNSGNFLSCCQGLVTTDFYAIEGGSGPYFYISTDNGSSFHHTRDINSPVTITDGVWYHLAGTFDGINLQFYLNGQPWGNPLNYPGTISPMLENSFLSFGSEDGRTTCNFCINTRYFNGLIDEIGIYNRALSAQEINDIYNCTKISLNNPLNIPPEKAYLCSDNIVEILDLQTLCFTGQIPIPSKGARMIEIIKSKNIACVTHNNGVSKLDLNTNTIISTLNLPGFTQIADIAITPNNKLAFFTIFNTKTVGVLDIDTWTLIKLIPLTNIDNPNGIEMGQGGQYVFVANQTSGNIIVIDAQKLSIYKTIVTNTTSINELALTSGEQTIFATANNQNQIVVIDSKEASVINYISLQHTANAVDITKNGKTAYTLGNGLSTINTQSYSVINYSDQIWGGGRIRLNSNDKIAILTRPIAKQILVYNIETLDMIALLQSTGNRPFGLDYLLRGN